MKNSNMDADLGIPFSEYVSIALDFMKISLLLVQILYMRDDEYEQRS